MILIVFLLIASSETVKQEAKSTFQIDSSQLDFILYSAWNNSSANLVRGRFGEITLNQTR